VGAPAPTQSGEKKFLGLIYRKMCKCTPGHEVHPQPEQESILRTVFAGWLRFGGIFRRSLRATTKKGRQLFWPKKCTPRQNPGYAYVQQLGIPRLRCWRSLLKSVEHIERSRIIGGRLLQRRSAETNPRLWFVRQKDIVSFLNCPIAITL